MLMHFVIKIPQITCSINSLATTITCLSKILFHLEWHEDLSPSEETAFWAKISLVSLPKITSNQQEMSFDYMYQYWNTYRGKRKFMINKIVAAHEFSGENSRYTDIELAKVLEKMDSEELLDNTIIYLYSDHANHINFLMLTTRSGYAEKMNPMFFMIMPAHVAEKHHENILWNQQKLMSHYQIFHNTVRYLGYDKTTWDKNVLEKESIFYDRLPTDATCEYH